MEAYFFRKLDAIFDLLAIEDKQQSWYAKLVTYLSNIAFILTWMVLSYLFLKFLVGFIISLLPPYIADAIHSLLRNGMVIFFFIVVIATTVQWALAIKMYFKPVKIMAIIGAVKLIKTAVLLLLHENGKDYLALLKDSFKHLF